MQYWLVKSEPDECGIDDFLHSPKTSIPWDGVRNFQARNFLKQMGLGDAVILYHSSCQHIGISGLLQVTRTAYDDPLQFQLDSPYFDAKSTLERPRWVAVDMVYTHKFTTLVPLATLKLQPALSECYLLTHKRLSVMPLTFTEFTLMQKLGGLTH